MPALKFQPSSFVLHRITRPLVHLGCLLPFILLCWNAFSDNLGTNPVETLTHTTGEWTLRWLYLSLSISPLIAFTHNAWLIVFRRPLGLYAFFYGLTHFFIYFGFDQSFNLTYVWEDIAKRPYITVGFTALILMLPLVFTSTKSMRRRLGKQWQTLHRLSYIIGLLGLIHLIWIIRADYAQAWYYGVFFGLIMLTRFLPARRDSVSRQSLRSNR